MSEDNLVKGFFDNLFGFFTKPIVWLAGYVVGFVSVFVAGGSTLRALEQASNIALPNEIPDVARVVEMYRRGSISSGEAESIMVRHGFDGATTSSILALSNSLLGITELVNLYFKAAISADQYYSLASMLGVSQEQAQHYVTVGEPRLDILTVMSAWRRGFFDPNSPDSYFQDLAAQGWTPDRVELLKQVTSYLPPVTDLIRFLLRDVYIPEYVTTYGMDQEFPESSMADFTKLGVDRDTAIKYWEAHWELPSISQGYEMYQRGQIDLANLNRLLRAQGIEPFWRDKLIAVAYHPIPRVQIRQFHAYGTLKDADLPAAYEQIGYSPDNAKLFADFTITYNKAHPIASQVADQKVPPQYHGESVALIMTGYDNGLGTAAETSQALVNINIPQPVADYIVAIHDAKAKVKALKDEQLFIEDSFLMGQINLQQAQTQLGALGLTEGQMAKSLSAMIRARRKQAAMPTKAELKKLYEAKVFDTLTYVQELRNLGYADKYINWYLIEEGLDSESILIALQQ